LDRLSKNYLRFEKFFFVAASILAEQAWVPHLNRGWSSPVINASLVVDYLIFEDNMEIWKSIEFYWNSITKSKIKYEVPSGKL